MRLTRVTLFFVLMILGLGFHRLGDYLLKDIESQTFQATEEMMVDTSHLLASLIEIENASVDTLSDLFIKAHEHSCEAQIFKHLKTTIGLHAYLTDAQGIVHFDSAHPEHVGKNFSQKRDVSRTLRGEYGARSSHDKLNPTSSIMYVGAPIFQNEKIVGCLTVYKSQVDVFPFIEMRRREIIYATLFIGLGILVLIGAVFLWLFRPIGKLTKFARAITRGERQAKPEVGLGREVNTLANSLHDMREALEGRKYADQYLQTLTHELKSPLAAIRGAAELIDGDMPAKDRDRFLSNIRNQTERCEDLIHRLLELSAVESQSHLENLSDFDLTDTCETAADTLRLLAEAKEIQLVLDLPSQTIITGNERLILSAISHILENAIQFSPTKGQVTLTLSSHDTIDLTIIDEGIGIPDFAAERAFERFYSYRKESNSKGNGLGLSFVKEVMDLHQGSTKIQALPEKGTAVTLFFPNHLP